MLGFYSGPRQTITSRREYILAPRWLMRSYDVPFIRSQDLTLFESFWHFCRERRPKSILLHRTYALGDILMLLPVARALRRKLGALHGAEPAMTIAVGFPFFHQLREMPAAAAGVRLIESRGVADYGCDVHLEMNSVLEIDHRGGEASDVHRVALYARSLGMELEDRCPR